MKCAVVYSSLTGNTYKIARAIYDGVECIDKFINVDDVDYNEILNYDTIIFCYWNRRNTANPDAMKFLTSIKEKNIFAVGTLGSYPDSKHGLKMKENVREAIKKTGNNFIGEYICQGRIDPVKTERRQKIDKDRSHYLDEEGLKRHIESRNHPNLNDIADAIALVNKSLGIE